MKNRTHYIGMIAALICLCVAGTWSWAKYRSLGRLKWRPTRPSIHISTTEVNFGRLRPLQEVVQTVIIENRGGQPLHMQTPTATCGCQKPVLGKLVLAPGERTNLTLRQQARSESGSFMHVVTINSDDPDVPSSLVYLKGTVSRGVLIRPEPLVFGPLSPGEVHTEYLEIASDRRESFCITHKHSQSGLMVSVPMGRPSLLHRVEVTLHAPKKYGPIHDEIILKTDIPDALPLSIQVEGQVIGPVRLIPAALSLGTVRSKQEVTRNVILSGDLRRYRLIEISGPSGGGWHVRHRSRPLSADGRSQVVELTIQVPEKQGIIEQAIRIEMEAGEAQREILVLHISGVIYGRARAPVEGGGF